MQKNRTRSRYYRLVHLIVILTFVFIFVPKASAQPPTPEKPKGWTGMPPDALKIAVTAALDSSVDIQTLGDDDGSTVAIGPEVPHVRRIGPDSSFGAYGTGPQGSQQKYIDEAAKPFNKGAIDASAPSSASGSGFARGGNLIVNAPTVDKNAIAAALHQADQAASYGLQVLNAVNGGNWNQFLGSPTVSSGWSQDLQDPLYAGAAASGSNTIPTVQNVLGLTTPQSDGAASPFVQRLDNYLFAPWTSGSLDTGSALQQRFQTLAQHQIARYYTDNDLSGMRAEENKRLIFYVYTDPYYLYWSYELNSTIAQIRATRPSYSTLTSLTQEVASWTTAPTDTITLRQRYIKRLLLPYVQTQVNNETATFIASNAQLATAIIVVDQWLSQRLNQIWSQPEVALWYADWLQRWQAFYYLSQGADAERQEVTQLLKDYPLFDEYQQLNNEVVELLPSFNDFSAVQKVNTLSQSIQNDQGVAVTVNQYYNQYKGAVAATIASSPVIDELESFYDRLNGLADANPTYQQLKTVQSLAVIRLNHYQQEVHDAVAQCFATSGPACNAYDDSAVISLLTNSSTIQLVIAVGDFYEVYNRFWYTFYTSPEYQSLEQDFKAKVQVALNQVMPSLQSARNDFTTNVNSIPQIKELHQARTDMVTALRGEGSQLSSLPISDPSPEIRKRLDRMAVLASQLNSLPTTSIQSRNISIYLPLILR